MPPVAPAVPESSSRQELSERLEQIKARLGGYAQISRLTGLCSESIRRWCQTGRPTVEFVAALRTKAKISSDWLLYDEGPMDVRDHTAWVLGQATVCELLLTVGVRIASLEEAFADLKQAAESTTSPTSSVTTPIPLRTDAHTTNDLKQVHSPQRQRAGAE